MNGRRNDDEMRLPEIFRTGWYKRLQILVVCVWELQIEVGKEGRARVRKEGERNIMTPLRMGEWRSVWYRGL